MNMENNHQNQIEQEEDEFEIRELTAEEILQISGASAMCRVC